MSKKIIIGILAGVSVLSLGFGYLQSVAANRARSESELNLMLALETEKKASKLQQMADVNAAEAMRQRQLYEELIQNCKGKK